MPDRHLDRTLPHRGIVEGHVVDVRVQGDSHPTRGGVADLGHGGRSTHEAVLEGDDPRGAVGLLLAHLQCALVGHRAGVGREAVTDPRALRRLLREELRELDALRVVLEVAFHHDVAQRGLEGGADHPRITVPEHVHADPVDHVPLHGAVDELDQRSATDAASDVRIERPLAPRLRGAGQPALERLGPHRRRGPGPVDRGLIRLEPGDHRVDGGRDFGAVTKRFGDGAGLGRAHAKNLLEHRKREITGVRGQ